MDRRGCLSFILSALLCALITGCGAADPTVTAPPAAPPQTLAQALADLDRLPTPTGVDAAAWDGLKQALRTLLSESGTRRFASALPSDAKCEVTDLVVTGDTVSATFTWTFRNVADYDQNGEVNIADLTPLGGALGKTPAAPDWARAQISDGDSNGEVNISDVTPIGANFRNSVTGYHLQRSADGASAWVNVDQILSATDGIVPTGGGRKTFAHVLDGGDAAFYRVVPFSGDELGPPSNVVQLVGASPLPGVWPVGGGGPGGGNLATLPGPLDFGTRRRMGTSDRFVDVTVGPDNLPVAGGDNGKVSKLTPQGGVSWVYEAGSSVPNIEVATDSHVYGLSVEGRLFRLDPDGAEVWALETGVLNGSFDAYGDGRTLITKGDTMWCYDADGGLLWTYDRPGERLAEPHNATNGYAYVSSFAPADAPTSHRLYALDADGNELWTAAEELFLLGYEIEINPVNSQAVAFISGVDELASFDATDGSVAWSKAPSSGTRLYISIGPNGHVYVGQDGAGNSEPLWIWDADGVEVDGIFSEGYQNPVVFGLDGSWYFDNDEGDFIARRPNGDFYNQPILYALTGGGHGDLDGNLYAGRGRITKYDYDGNVAWRLGRSGRPHGPVFAADGRMYLAFDGLYCLNADLSVRWFHDAEGMEAAGSPAIGADGTVYYTAGFFGFGEPVDSALFAVSPDGAELWRDGRAGLRFSPPNIGSDGTVYAATSTGQLLGFDPADGAVVFDEALSGGTQLRPQIRATGGGDEIYVAVYFGSMLQKFAADGTLLWSYDYNGTLLNGNLTVDADGNARFGTSTAFYAIAADGSELHSPIAPDILLTDGGWTSLRADGTVIRQSVGAFAPYDVRIMALEPDGDPLWEYQLPDADWNTGAVTVDADGRCFFANNETLYCLAADGSPLWTMAIPHSPRVQPVLGPGGSLYMYQPGGELLVIDP